MGFIMTDPEPRLPSDAGTLVGVAMTERDQWIGRVLGARYRLVAAIGRGGMGHVYLADDVRLRRQVAVKLLHPALTGDSTFLRRFEAEAQAVAALSHPHVLTVHDWGHDESGPFLVSEYLAGGSLQAMLDGGRRLTPAQSIKVGLEAASGLAAAHARGMVHRDIKPANLLFDHTGRLRIADFGLVQAIEDAGVTEHDAAGTARYLAPERAGDRPLDGRTDVYALVLTMIESVTGHVPLGSGTAAEVVARRQTTSVDIPVEMDAAAPVMSRAGRADPEERPFAIDFRNGLVESTRHFTAPARLPLVGALPDGAPPYGGGEPTMVPATPLALPPEVDASLDVDVETAPRPRWKPTRGLAALVALLLGVGTAIAGWVVSDVDPPRTPTHLVEDYSGRPVEDVRLVAEANDWVLDEDQLRSDTAETGTVLTQHPGSGQDLAEGELLSVEVVSGPLLRMTPTVVGLRSDDAVTRLEARGFEVETSTPRFDELIAADVVMELVIDGEVVHGGVLREPGTRVNLVLSSGPVPRTVPRVVDLGVEQALDMLAAVQLRLVEAPEREFSETVADGVVIRQDITPGLQVERDTEVVVVVSKGPDRREVPNVIGMTISEATDRLEAVGLARSGVSGGGDVVEATDPAPGTLLPPGTEVLLWAPSS